MKRPLGVKPTRLAVPNPVDACACVALEHDRVNIEQRVRSGEKNGEPVEAQIKAVQGDNGADDEVDEMTTLGGSSLRVVPVDRDDRRADAGEWCFCGGRCSRFAAFRA